MRRDTSYAPVAITGVAGYIGPQVARELLRLGRRVVGIDNLSTGFRGCVPYHDSLAFFEADVGDCDHMVALLKGHGVKEVIHLAALVDVEESVRKPEQYYSENAQKTKALVKAAIEARVKTFVLSSTASVYGTTEAPVGEDAPLKPQNPYGVSKLHAELYLQKAAQESGLRYVILRYFNVAGADPEGRGGRSTKKPPTNLVTTAVHVALGLKPNGRDYLEINGTDYPTPDKTCIRDYIHVADIASAHSVALHVAAEGRSGIFNVGTGQGSSVLEVAAAVKRLSGKPLPLRYVGRRPGDPVTSVARVDKIEKLGWHAQFDLEKMIKDELRWIESIAATSIEK